MICCCALAGTKACEHCFNNSGYSWTTTVTTTIPVREDLTKEDYKEILKYIIDKKEMIL